MNKYIIFFTDELGNIFAEPSVNPPNERTTFWTQQEAILEWWYYTMSDKWEYL